MCDFVKDLLVVDADDKSSELSLRIGIPGIAVLVEASGRNVLLPLDMIMVGRCLLSLLLFPVVSGVMFPF